MPMDPEIKKAWVEALRSGRYQQGKGALHRKGLPDDQFCCLGVLCELAVEAGQAERFEHAGGLLVFYRAGNRLSGFLPDGVAVWAGLTSSTPRVEVVPNVISNLVDLNDEGMSFTEIADLIEAQL